MKDYLVIYDRADDGAWGLTRPTPKGCSPPRRYRRLIEPAVSVTSDRSAWTTAVGRATVQPWRWSVSAPP